MARTLGQLSRGWVSAWRPASGAGWPWVRSLGLLSEHGMRRNCIRAGGMWRRSSGPFIFGDGLRLWRDLQRCSGNEGAADTETALTSQLFPHGLEVHANGRKNRDV